MDYRERCYQNYTGSLWEHTHSLSKEEYEFFAKISRTRYKDILPKNRDVKIIDIACGGGHFLYFLKKEGYTNIQGIDLSEGQLELARKMELKNIQKADLFEYMPKHPECFDMIVANDIIEHLKKDEILKLLDIIHQSLVPGGRVLISTPNACSLLGAGLIDIDFTHEQGFTPESLRQVLIVCKFEDVSVYGEKPITHDLKSTLRAGLWWCMKKALSFYTIIERGTGRGMWKRGDIFEPRIFAVGVKHKLK